MQRVDQHPEYRRPTEPKIDQNDPVFDTSPISWLPDVDRRFEAPEPAPPPKPSEAQQQAKLFKRYRDPAVLAAKVLSFIRLNSITKVDPKSVHTGEIGMLPKKRDPEIDAMIQAFIAKNGAIKIPTGFVTTYYGSAAISAYEGQAADNARYYDGRQPAGSSRHKAIGAIRALAYADRLSVVGDPSWLKDELHNRHCVLPSCLKKLDDDKPPQAKYCSDKCSRKDRRRLDAIGHIAANSTETLVRVCSPSIIATESNQISELDPVDWQEIETPNTYGGDSSEISHSSRDPIRLLFISGDIDQHQLDAATALQHDLDSVDGRLRAPERDAFDISVWRPRAPDSDLMTKSRNHIDAAMAALGPKGVSLVRDAIAGRPIDTVPLRTVLNKLAVVYGTST